MLSDEVDEELRIMAEREQPALDQETFRRSVVELCHRPITLVAPDDSVLSVVQLMQEKEIGAVGVAESNRLVGIFTERDVFRRALREERVAPTAVSSVMTPNPSFLYKNDSVVALMSKMHLGGYRHVPIVDDDDRPLHMVSVRDLLVFFFSHFPPHLINAPSDPYRGPPRQYGG